MAYALPCGRSVQAVASAQETKEELKRNLEEGNIKKSKEMERKVGIDDKVNKGDERKKNETKKEYEGKKEKNNGPGKESHVGRSKEEGEKGTGSERGVKKAYSGVEFLFEHRLSTPAQKVHQADSEECKRLTELTKQRCLQGAWIEDWCLWNAMLKTCRQAHKSFCPRQHWRCHNYSINHYNEDVGEVKKQEKSTNKKNNKEEKKGKEEKEGKEGKDGKEGKKGKGGRGGKKGTKEGGGEEEKEENKMRLGDACVSLVEQLNQRTEKAYELIEKRLMRGEKGEDGEKEEDSQNKKNSRKSMSVKKREEKKKEEKEGEKDEKKKEKAVESPKHIISYCEQLTEVLRVELIARQENVVLGGTCRSNTLWSRPARRRWEVRCEMQQELLEDCLDEEGSFELKDSRLTAEQLMEVHDLGIGVFPQPSSSSSSCCIEKAGGGRKEGDLVKSGASKASSESTRQKKKATLKKEEKKKKSNEQANSSQGQGRKKEETGEMGKKQVEKKNDETSVKAAADEKAPMRTTLESDAVTSLEESHFLQRFVSEAVRRWVLWIVSADGHGDDVVVIVVDDVVVIVVDDVVVIVVDDFVVIVVDDVVVIVVDVYLKCLRMVLRCAKACCGRRTSSS